jgi:predicted enzyme related to lactoylglutathione lyase
MGARSEYAPGTFSWVDLTTADPEAAKAFYGGLFGWQFDDSEIPGDGFYSICLVGGESAAAIAPATDRYPPHWNSYVTVAKADDAVARAKELGATVIEEPFDVLEAGRMAFLLDPTGAGICLWEPRGSIGATRVNDPGCLTWNELHTPEPSIALDFHRALFGWSLEEMPSEDGVFYTIVKVGERTNGGVMSTQEGEPPNWLPYFTVEDRDAAAERVAELGGRELHRMEMPQGRTGIFLDPQGAPFGVFEGEVDH